MLQSSDTGGSKKGRKVLGIQKVKKGADKPYTPKDWIPLDKMHKGSTEDEVIEDAAARARRKYASGQQSAKTEKFTLKPRTGKPIPMPKVKTGKDALAAEKWRRTVKAFNGDKDAWKT